MKTQIASAASTEPSDDLAYIPDPQFAASEAAGRLVAVSILLDKIEDQREDDPDDGGYVLATVIEQIHQIRELLLRSVRHAQQEREKERNARPTGGAQ